MAVISASNINRLGPTKVALQGTALAERLIFPPTHPQGDYFLDPAAMPPSDSGDPFPARQDPPPRWWDVVRGVAHASPFDVKLWNPLTYKPRSLMKFILLWVAILSVVPPLYESACKDCRVKAGCWSHPAASTIEGWIRGVNVVDFFVPFKGRISGVDYDCPIPPPRIFKNSNLAREHAEFVTKAVNELHQWGAARRLGKVGEVPPPKVVAPLSVEPTKPRLIWDGRYVNTWTRKIHFQLDSLDLIPRVLPGVDDLFFITDAKSGYFHVGLDEASQQYFGFEWDGYYYVYTVIPFGWSPSCLIYNTIAGVPWRFLRSLSYPGIYYIDDSLGRASFAARCSAFCAACDAAFVFMKLATALGFYYSAKSEFIPGYCKKFLGFYVDSHTRRFIVPEAKIEKLAKLRKVILSEPSVCMKSLERFSGMAGAMARAVPGAYLYLRRVYAHQADMARREVEGEPLPPPVRAEVETWEAFDIWEGSAPWIDERHVRCELFTDASGFAWGGIMFLPSGEAVSCRGFFHDDDLYRSLLPRSEDIQWKEARAVELVCCHFLEYLEGARVPIGVDSQSVLGAWAKDGGANPLVNERLKAVLYLQLSANFVLIPWYVRSKDNFADAPSRVKVDHNDHMLNPDIFARLNNSQGFGVTHEFPGFTLDAMASGGNVQKTRYGVRLPFFSRDYDPAAAGRDVFAFDCSRCPYTGKPSNVYVNPPWCLILPLITFFRQCRCRVTVIVPEMTTEPWWPVVIGQAIDHMAIASQGDRNVFLQPSLSYKDSVGPVPWNVWALLFDFR